MFRSIRKFFKNNKDLVFTVFFISIAISMFVPGHITVSIAIIATVSLAFLYFILGIERLNLLSIPLWVMIFYYLYLALSGVWSLDSHQYMVSIQMKSMLLGIPFIFLVYRHFPMNYFQVFSYILVFMIFVSGVYVIYDFSHNSLEYLTCLEQGRSIPVPFRNHIRYSVLLNFAFMLSLFNVRRGPNRSINPKFILWVFISILLFFYIQFLAVKTGIVMSFIILITYSIHKVLKSKEYIVGLTILISICMISILILSKMPTVKKKLDYIKYDISMMNSKERANFSDGERLTSIKHGLVLSKLDFWKGQGEGSVRKVMKDHYPNERLDMPHNQFVVTLLQNGVIGFLMLFSVFVSFVTNSIVSKNWMLFAYLFSMFFCLMVEPMLETQMGVLLFAFPLCMLFSLKKVHKL